MKTKLKTTLALIAAVCGLQLFAATPVVVWDHDFSTAQKTGTDNRTYTFARNGANVVDGNGCLVIGSTATKGATVSWSDATTDDQKCSVLIKYSKLAHPGAAKTLAAIRCTKDSTSYDMGARCEADSLQMKGYYNGTANYAFGTVPTLNAGSGYYLLTVDNTSGVSAFAGTSEANLTGGKNTSLKFGSYLCNGVSLGGCYDNTTFGTWKDVVIEAVAIFPKSACAASDVAAYKFPSDVMDEAYLWLDASTLTGGAGSEVSSWASVNAGGKTASTTGTKPTIAAGWLNGKKVVDFGDAGSGKDLTFDKSTTVRTVFMVADVAQSANVFLLSDATSNGTYHFHRGDNGAYFNSSHGSRFLDGTYRNGVKVASPGSTLVPTGFGLITLVGNNNATANSIGNDRGISGRNGGKKIAELLVFNRVLTSDEIAFVESYLTKKWFQPVVKGVKWGNLGTSAVGSATSQDGSFGYADWTVNFAADDNIVNMGIGKTGKVKVNSITLMKRENKENVPASITLKQGSVSVTSGSPENISELKIYKTDHTVLATREGSKFTFATPVEFDVSQNIAMTFNTKSGCSVVKVANSVMKYTASTGDWSPAIEFDCDYDATVPGRSISINFGATTDDRTVTGVYGFVPSSKWTNFSTATGTDQEATVSDDSKVSVTWSCANNHQKDAYTDAALKGYLDDGGSQVSISISDIPFKYYDVIVYQATDSDDYAFNPPSINGTFYSYDGTKTGSKNDTALKYGSSSAVRTATYGQNVVYLHKGFSGAFTLAGGGNVNTARGCIAAIQIVEVFPSPYSATITSTPAKWATQEGLTKKTGGFWQNGQQNTIELENTTLDSATMFFNTFTEAGKLTLTSASGKDTTFAGWTNTKFGNYDFSAASGAVGFDAKGTSVTADANLKTLFRANANKKYVFYGQNANGVTIDYGSTEAERISDSQLFGNHFVFDGGTHTFKSTSSKKEQLFGANATVDNPTFYAKNGATLNWYSKDPCGWGVQTSANGIIRIDGTSKIKTLNSESGTWYWVQQFYLDPGAQLEIAAASTALTGGANENAPHFFMPASQNGTATISSSGSGSFRLTKDSYPGVGVSVGEGSTLLVTASLASTATQSYLAKYGAGTLKFTGNTTSYQGGLQVKAGRMIYASASSMMAAATVSIDSGAQFVFGAANNTFANVISGAGALVKDGANTTTTLSGANTYSGGTTVEAGTLVVTTPNGAYTVNGGTLTPVNPNSSAITVNQNGTFSYAQDISAGGTFAKSTFAAVNGGTVNLQATMSKADVQSEVEIAVADVTGDDTADEFTVTIINADTLNPVECTKRIADGVLYAKPQGAQQTHVVTPESSGDMTWQVGSQIGEKHYRDYDNITFATTVFTNTVNVPSKIAATHLTVGGTYNFTGSMIIASLLDTAEGAYATFANDVIADSVIITNGTVMAKEIVAREVAVTNATFGAKVLGPSMKYVRLSITATQSSENAPAVAEFRLYRGSATTGYTIVDWPVGTIVSDDHGNRVVKETSGYPATVGTSNERQPGCLIDGVYGDSTATSIYGSGMIKNNKWWLNNDTTGPWVVTIEFPDPVAMFSGCNFCLADTAARNPKTWTIKVSSDGENWTTVNETSAATWGSQWAWAGEGENVPAFLNTGTTPTDVKVGTDSTIVADGTWTAALEVGGDVTFKGVAGKFLTLDAASKSKFDDGAHLTFDLTTYDVSSAGKQYVVAGPTTGWPEVDNIEVIPDTFSLYKATDGYYVVVENGNYWVGNQTGGVGTWDLRNTKAWATNATETTKKLVWLNGEGLGAFFTRNGTVTIDTDAAITPAFVNVTSNDNVAVTFNGAVTKLANVPLNIGSTNVTVTFNSADALTLGAITAVADSTPKFVKTGAGTMTVNSGNQFAGGAVVVSNGTLLVGSTSAFTGLGTLTAEGAGVIDVNGKAITRAFTLGAGGSLVNKGNSIGTGSAQMNGLELTGNASVGGTGNFGLIASQYGASTLTLGDNTLTKTGANSFWLCNTTITGEGTIQVDEGTLAVNSDSAKDSTFADGTISVGASGALLIAQNRTLTVKNVTLAAANGVTATGTLKVTGVLDATAAGATIGNLTLEGTPTVKLTAEPLAITTLGFGTDATTVDFDFTGAPFEAWATAGVTSTQMVSVASFPMARLGTIMGVPSGWYLDITANGLVLTTNGSKESTISDQTDLGSLYVPGTETLKGTGGAIASALAFAPNAKIVIDPVRTPLKVSAKPVFKTGAKIALASAYAETSLGKLTLISWVGGSLGLEAEGLKALVDETTFNSATYTVEETGDDTLRQLVLKIGNYDTAAKDVTISQFGDSITEGIWRSGYRGTPNYRIPLMQMLEAKGYRPVARGFRNVMNGATSATLTVPGSSDANGVPAPDAYAWHNGISAQRIYTGMTSGNLRAGFMESVESHLEQVGVTDIITLKIGTNDAIGGETADNIFEGYTNLVWKIKNMRPTTQIYLCSPIPNHNSSEADARAKAAAASMKAYIEAGHFGGNVFFVDGYNAVPNEDAYYLTDKVHPNWNGHIKLAERFCTDITAQFTPSSPHATEGYVAKTTRTAETNIPAEYRNGYVKLLTFTNVVDKATAWTGGVPYTYTNTAYVAKKFDRIAYYVENKTKVSPDTRFVWVDMDAAEVGRSLADFCIPTNVQKNVLAKNLHVYSNSSAMENIAPTVEGVNGTIMLTSKGCTAAGGITGAPDSVFGLDWNDTLGNTAWGIMTVSRVFSGVTRTNHRIATEAQILFDYNGYNLAAHGNSLGIGDFAVHCKQNEGNSSVSTVTLNWIFASDNITKMNADQLDYGVVEIWGKVGPATTAVSAEITDATTDWSQLEWTDTEGTKFTGLTGAYNYTLTGEGKTVALTETLKDGATVTLSSGTLNLADGASIGATSSFSIAEGATLGVTTTNVVLKASKVTNNGTIAFNGGTAANPIVYAADVTKDTNLGTWTLDASTYVKVSAADNMIYKVTGQGASTSSFELTKSSSGGIGTTTGTQFRNLTFVSAAASGEKCWIERADSFDSTVNVVVKSGEYYLYGYSPTIGTLSGAESVTRSGSETLTITPTADATYSGTSSVPFTIAAGSGTQTLSGAYTGALTVNEGATVALGGSAAPSSIVNNGTVKYLSGSTCNLGAARSPNGTCIFEEGVTITATETRAEYGAGGVITFTGFTAGRTITLHRFDGTEEALTVDAEGKATSQTKPAVIDQMATYADATFTNATSTTSGNHHYGTLSYKSISGLGLEYDSPVTTNSTGTGAYLKHHPWITGLPNTFMQGEEMTIAVVGEMSPNNNTMFVHFGTTTYSNKGILLATGTKTDEVVVKMNTGSSLTLITTMTVPNAATARHVYIITKKDVGEKSTVSVYLDGTPWKTVTFDKISLTGGIQCGSDHGGVLKDNHIVEAVGATDTALINVLRVYDRVISSAEIAKYTSEYPYTSPNGTSSRKFEAATGNWIEDEGTNLWSYKKDQATEAVATNKPAAKSSIAITGSSSIATVISVNLNVSTNYEALTISGADKFTFAKADGMNGLIGITGQATIGCPVEVQYGTVDVSGAPLTLTDSGSLAFDLSTLNVTNIFKTTEIPLTGDTDETDKITIKNTPSVTGRSVALTRKGSQYVLTVTVTSAPLVYTVAQGESEGQWSFHGVDCDEPTDWTQVNSTQIQKKGAGTGTIAQHANFAYSVVEGTLVLSTGDYGTIAISAGAVLDVGTRRDVTVSGAGNVKAKFETGPQPGDVVMIFKVADSATTGIAELKKSDDSVIPAEYYTVANGVVTFKKEAKIGTQYYFVLTEALNAAAADATVTLCTNVTDFAYTLDKNLMFDGDIWEITGDGFTVGAEKTLTIAGGYIGMSRGSGTIVLTGGKFTDDGTNTWAECMSTANYHFADLASLSELYESYKHQIIAGSETRSGEAVYPAAVVDGGTTNYVGDLAFTKQELKDKGIIESTETSDADVAKALSTPGKNERPTWENVVLGLSNTDPLAAPVPTPVQSSDPSKIKLRLDNLDVSTTSGAKVTYKVTTTTGGVETTKTAEGVEAEFDLPQSGVSYYKFEVTVTPAK